MCILINSKPLAVIWLHSWHRCALNVPCVSWTIIIQEFSRRRITVKSVAVADDTHFIERRLKPGISCDAFGTQLFYVSRISFNLNHSIIIYFCISTSITGTILAFRILSYLDFTRPHQPGVSPIKSFTTIDPIANRILFPWIPTFPFLIYGYFSWVLIFLKDIFDLRSRMCCYSDVQSRFSVSPSIWCSWVESITIAFLAGHNECSIDQFGFVMCSYHFPNPNTTYVIIRFLWLAGWPIAIVIAAQIWQSTIVAHQCALHDAEL